jgi:regulatory protein
MSRSEDPDNSSKISGSPKNIKAETADMPPRAQARQKKAPKKITETYLHNSALYYLQRFAASSNQFRKVMQRKIDLSCRHHTDQNPEDCRELLERLVTRFQDNGLLNDDTYARGMVITLRRRGISERAIFMKLQNKGLSEGQIKDALEGFNSENDTSTAESEYRAALKLARKKRVGPYAVVEFEYDRALSAFARAGFSFDVARRVLGMTAEDLNDDPEDAGHSG